MQGAAAGDKLHLENCARRGQGRSSEFRIERVAQPVAEQVDGKDQPGQRNAGEGHDPPFAREQIIVADPDQGAERGMVSGMPAPRNDSVASVMTASPRLMVRSREPDPSHSQHMAQHDDGGGQTDQLGGGDIILVLLDHDRAAYGCGHIAPRNSVRSRPPAPPAYSWHPAGCRTPTWDAIDEQRDQDGRKVSCTSAMRMIRPSTAPPT